ncbi:MAG TPA: sterol desaturase family protein [Xanthomonadaceae bacterium]|nr:sterol desaturase family protein [Xanthomonadaceae bacterium]
MAVDLPEAVAQFRSGYRAHEIPRGYRGGVHAAVTFGGGSLALALCLAQLEPVRAWEWLAVPLAFLYANLAEYVGHRWPMHRPVRGLGLVYRRHAGQHHRFFHAEAMALESARDLRAVLFPPLLVVFFFGVFGIPLWLLLAWLLSTNVAWLFLATGLGYFLSYELLHLSHHAPAGSWPTRRRWLGRLRRLHRDHHDPAWMTRANFNITWPICDAVFGTLRHRDGG